MLITRGKTNIRFLIVSAIFEWELFIMETIIIIYVEK